MDTSGTLTVTEGTIEGTRQEVHAWERRNIAGNVFVDLRIEAQLLGAAATALIPSNPYTLEEFLNAAGLAYQETTRALKERVDKVVTQREAELNPPPAKPPIIDVG